MYLYLLKKMIKEGLQNIKKHSFMSFASCMIIFVAMIFLNVFILTTINVHSLSQQFNNEIKIDVFLDKGLDKKQLKELKEKLVDLSNVKDVTFVSKHQSISQIATNYGEAFENLKEESNPLYDKYEVTLEKNEALEKTNEKIQKLKHVFQSVYAKDIVEDILYMSNYFRNFSSLFLVVSVIFVVVILFITLSMGIKARQEEIETRALIGATPLFISVPFIFQSIFITEAGGLIAAFVSLKIYQVFSDRINSLIGSLGYTFVSWREIMVYIWVISSVASLFIGIVTALIATRRNIYYPK